MKLLQSKLFWFAALLVLVCLVMTLFSAATGRPSVLRNLTGAVVTPLQKGVSSATDWFSDLFGYFYRYDDLELENQQLRQKIQEYEKLEIAYNAAIKENDALREAAGVKAKRADFSLELCSVVSLTGKGFESTLTLDRGSISGIEAGDCVITGDGLVGFVDEVGLNHCVVKTVIHVDDGLDHCVVKTVIHVDFSSSASVSRTREVVVTGGNFELASDGLLKVSYLENDADVRPGDVILTNGGAYPPDLIIGRVEEFRQESHGISSYASVRPAVEFDHLSTVLVVKEFHVDN